MSVPEPVIEGVRDMLRAAGLKPDVSASRISRAVREAAESHGVAVDDVLGAGLNSAVLERLAVHESWFFREPRQFSALARTIVPALSSPLHVWCAGCSLGQEAWSVAMVLAESFDGEWRITATDVSEAAVAVAERGVYPAAQLRGLSADRRGRFVRKTAEDQWEITPSLRSHLQFLRHNVATDGPAVPAGEAQVVLCRNVLIYLSDDGVAAALSSIDQALEPGGWLLVGTAETLWRATDEFEVVSLPGAYAYRKPGAMSSSGSVSGSGSGASPARQRRRSGVVEPLPDVPVPDVTDLLARAAAAAGSGRHEEAARVFRQAAYLDPDRVDAHAGLADALEAVGDVRGAARARAVVRRINRQRA